MVDLAPHSIRKDVAGLAITVVGAARSGAAAAELLAGEGARVFVTENRQPDSDAGARFERSGIDYEFGGHSDRGLDAELLVISPGVPSDHPLVVRATQQGVPVRSELEVASWFCRAPIVAVTGSNGKTTTTALLGHVFREAGRRTWVAGNIGLPFSVVAPSARSQDVVVLEVSSFQLDHVDLFRPRVSILLNITPDHLDRYGGDIEQYAVAKLRITRRQSEGDGIIFNADDPRLTAFASSLDAREGPAAYPVTLDPTRHDTAAFVRSGQIVLRINDTEEELMRAEELALRGRHNLHNSLAAAVAARVMEVRSDVVRESLKSFEGVPHRLEQLREIGGVKYVNDSKATNVNAVWYALESFNEPIVLIAGGRDKGNDYEPLKPVVSARVRVLIALGESAQKVERELAPCAEAFYPARSMADAVQIASAVAQSGEIVLLSPACASFDQFENFEHRGDTFRRLVGDL